MAEGAKMLQVYTIVEREGLEKSFWIKVGACFTNRDGSFNVYLDALPTNGRLQIREKFQEQASE
ncbi:MAG TPA: hypothetical protein VM425_06855 [Myxococcota bacterium]|nr:hypothetical protein [Myxococcota bacterium]